MAENNPFKRPPAAAGGATLADGRGTRHLRGGQISKADSPTAYGRVGNHAGSKQSSGELGDDESDPDAELDAHPG